MAPSRSPRRRVLFVAEAVTLAHVTRPCVLARSLDAERYEVHFACANGYESFLVGSRDITHWPIKSIPSERFLHALATGAPLYDKDTLESYLGDELRLIDDVRPDLVVGDFRLSLAVSTSLSKIPYVAITNAHWSPYSSTSRFPLPELPITRLLGVQLTTWIFHGLQQLILDYHGRAVNELRRKYGLCPLGDLRHVYTHGDFTLYADIPQVAPTTGLPSTHHYIGPILWSPDVPLPRWWNDVSLSERAVAYVTLGSSGKISLLPTVIEAIAALPVNVLVATAGRIRLNSLPGNVWVADYLPGLKAAQCSSVVVCNGGSATVYQALAAGVPVLGIVSNMDQHLTMAGVARAEAGIALRSEQTTHNSVADAASELMCNSSYRRSATRLAKESSKFNAVSRFIAFIDTLFGDGYTN
jgi:UDP:flavonoid glycosyltransferase YjiC (YdhE family)